MRFYSIKSSQISFVIDDIEQINMDELKQALNEECQNNNLENCKILSGRDLKLYLKENDILSLRPIYDYCINWLKNHKLSFSVCFGMDKIFELEEDMSSFDYIEKYINVSEIKDSSGDKVVTIPLKFTFVAYLCHDRYYCTFDINDNDKIQVLVQVLLAKEEDLDKITSDMEEVYRRVLI